MAEIGILPGSNLAVPLQNFRPATIDTTPPPAPPIDMSGAARAAMIAHVTQTLAGLPGQIAAGLQKKKQDELEAEKLKAQTELVKTQAEYYKSTKGQPKVDDGSRYYQSLAAQFDSPLAALNPAPGTPAAPLASAINPTAIDPSLVLPTSGGVSGGIDPDVILPANGEASLIPMAGEPVGKVTSYGYKNDSTPDKNSSAGIGAFVPDAEEAKILAGQPSDFRLRAGDIAVSPDVEQQFRASGIKPGDTVTVQLADGSTKQGRWMDRTAQDEQILAGRVPGVTQPLRGRFDFYSPTGVDPLDGVPVVGFHPASAQPASPPSQIAVDGQKFDIPAADLSAGPVAAPAAVTPAGPVAAPAMALDVTPPGQMLPTPNLPAIPAPLNPEVDPSKVRYDNPATGKSEMIDPDKMPVRKPALARDKASGIITVQSPGGGRYEVLPTGQVRLAPALPVDAKAEGMTFPSMEAAEAKLGKGAVQKAKLNPDGTVTVGEVVTPGSDIKGRGKLTDSTRNQLTSSITLANDMSGLEETHSSLYANNKAGPIAGRIQQALSKVGYGEGEYVGAQGKIEVGNFRIARLLNGPGVLTKNDLDRAQKVAPTLNETPESFKAKMNQVRESLLESIQTWKAANGAAATEEQVFLADEAIKKLQSETGKAAPGEAAKESVTPAKTAGMVLMKDPSTGETRYVNPADVEKAKKAGAVVVTQ